MSSNNNKHITRKYKHEVLYETDLYCTPCGISRMINCKIEKRD